MFIPEFIDFFVADGPAGGFDKSGVHGNAFIDGQSFGFKLAQDFEGLPRYKFQPYLIHSGC
jgi:hypothetical protein